MRKRYLFVLLLPLLGLLYFLKPQQSQSPTAVTEEKPFVIIVTAFNNSSFLEKTLGSIFSQNYDNYRVIYIDDHSFDDSFQKAESWLGILDYKKRTTLIQNPHNVGAVANFYTAAHLCQDHEIVIFLSGDDLFAHDNVLSSLNRSYANPHTWLTYGGSLNYPQYQKDPTEQKLPSKILRASSFRKYPLIPAHMTTCYATLVKQIHIDDLFYEGHFYPAAGKWALLYPLLEMAGSHSLYCTEPLYLKNCQNPLSENKLFAQFQQNCLEHIRQKPRYNSLQELESVSSGSKTADLLIFSDDNPLQLCALLESIDLNVKGLNKITVLYKCSSTDFENGYLELKLDYPQVTFIPQSQSLHKLVKKTLYDSPLTQSSYILFAKDTLIIQRPIDLTHSITLLENTHAYGIYFAHHLNLKFSSSLNRFEPIPPHTPFLDAYAWEFSSGMDDWSSAQNLSFSLYRKKDLKKVFADSEFTTLDTFLEEWSAVIPENQVGLFFPQGHCVTLIPEAKPKELLKKFLAGLKLDLTLFAPLEPESQEITTNFTYIGRE